MTRLQKMMFLIVIVLLVGVLSFDASLYFAQNVSPNRLKVNYYPLQDSKIPESLDDVTIVYFTDLQYGTFQNDTRTKRLFDQIRELNPDVLVFGGDLYDSATEPNEKSNKKLTEYFRSIQAPMGKYAVYGEKDWSSPTRKKAVKQIYHDSQIELLHNKNIRITDKDSKGIRLIGLTSTKGISKALDNVSGKTYNLLVTHKPDNFMAEALAQHSVSYGMAGHSH
ncbi:MAG: metallophosphoesterase [Erysipelotrichaceae bacterium]|nr:metallophosphoesterase [Erysipelotrichaceae bacterium]